MKIIARCLALRDDELSTKNPFYLIPRKDQINAFDPPGMERFGAGSIASPSTGFVQM